MSDSLVVIPTYNEKENIERMVRALIGLEPPVDVLVVDDASPDGTAAIVARLQPEFPERLFLERREGKRGLGHACLHGFRWALARSYAFILEMDADFSHPPADVARLRAACDAGADVAVGSRYVRGGEIKHWSARRRILSGIASLYVRLILWWPVRDATAGFICFRRDALAAIDLERVKFVGYAFLIEMKYAAYRRGLKLVEVPIVFVDRVAGTSKMSPAIFHEAFFGVWQLRLRR